MSIEESTPFDLRQRALLALQSGAAYIFAPRKAVTVVLGAGILARRFFAQTVSDAAAEGERQLDEINDSFTQAVSSFWTGRSPSEARH